MLKLFLNGEPISIEAPISIQHFIVEKKYSANAFAVAVNETFIPRRQYGDILLNEHDRIEIVSAMQGG